MNIVYATTTAYVSDGMTIHKGQHWSADDPVVRANPDLFSPDPRYGLTFSPGAAPREMAYAPGEEIPVEQATAGPGEKRTVRRPRGTDSDF